MSALLDRLLNLNATLVFVVVGLVVFAEDALFVGFVLPGETAAVLGGVIASQGRVPVVALIAIVVVAAIVGDSIGYEVGRRFGPRILAMRVFVKRRARLDDAQDFLRRRGGWAVLLGRFVAFFRAVMPALAGTSRMPYHRFLAFNAVGGILWGTGFVLVGYLAGHSYKSVESYVGRGSAIAVGAVVLVGVIVWRIRAHRAESAGPDQPKTVTPH